MPAKRPSVAAIRAAIRLRPEAAWVDSSGRHYGLPSGEPYVSMRAAVPAGSEIAWVLLPPPGDPFAKVGEWVAFPLPGDEVELMPSARPGSEPRALLRVLRYLDRPRRQRAAGLEVEVALLPPRLPLSVSVSPPPRPATSPR
jgi:hypothetical protein